MAATRSLGSDSESEDEKWKAEFRLRKRELELKALQQKQEAEFKKEELRLKQIDAARSRWLNPLVIAVFAAAAGAFGNAGVAWLNGSEQRKLEDQRAKATRDTDAERAKANLALEEARSEATRIFESIKIGDPDVAATNLKFLADLGLISGATAKKIIAYVDTRPVGSGAVLPSPTSSSSSDLGEVAGRVRAFWMSTPSNRSVVEDWLRKNAIDMPVAFFLRAAEQAPNRLRMLKELGIP